MGFIKEFKEFALKGNVVDLAIAVIIGAAFGAIVTSLVDDVITPLILSPLLKSFDVEDIAKEMERLKKEGFELLNEQPKPGADNKLVCFLHPKNTCGVLIELCQEIKPG